MAPNFKGRFNGSNRVNTSQHRRTALPLAFESLEDRWMMAANILATASDVDGKIAVVATGTAGNDRIVVTSYDSPQQITTRSGVLTIQIPKIEVKITDAGGATRRDAAGNLLVQSFDQAKVGSLRLRGDKGDDVITNDSSIPATIEGDAGNDSLYGGSADDYLDGNGGAVPDDGQNKLYGRGGNDYLVGGNLHDELWGGIGDDYLDGSDGDDNLYGEAGKDELHGGKGNDNLFGGLDDDQLWGGYGDDFLVGDGGNDLLVGEAGFDTLMGGSGNDTLMGGFRHFNLQVQISNQTFGQSENVYTQEDDGCGDHLWGEDGQDQVYYNPCSDWIDGWFQIGGGSALNVNPSGWVMTV